MVWDIALKLSGRPGALFKSQRIAIGRERGRLPRAFLAPGNPLDASEGGHLVSS
jgi:hypothetical protein